MVRDGKDKKEERGEEGFVWLREKDKRVPL
jgi:hypothetical protein